jgi:hypothetical protein
MAKQWRIRHERLDNTKIIRNNRDIENIDSKLFQRDRLPRDTSGHAADSAEDYLKRGEGLSQGGAGKSDKERLVAWARESGRLVSKIPWRLDGPRDDGGGEHHAFYDEKSDRWIKATRGSGSGFGVTLDSSGKEWGIGRASALQYLERNRLSNELFGDDIRLHAIYEDKHGNVNIITSQPHVRGEWPAPGELAEKMKNSGFIDLGHSSYYRGKDNSLILDLHDENAKSLDGELYPFDASILHPDDAQLDELRKQGVPIPERSSSTSLLSRGAGTSPARRMRQLALKRREEGHAKEFNGD